ncbi:MAG TPA: nodulation protein NfeD [Candidatus Acidoferrales bacterium]|nr:nodulation protein NfeD [Candidatus Acidoferrales bacterium]
MKHPFFVFVLVGASVVAARPAAAVPSPSPRVVVLTYSGPIGPASSEFIVRGIAEAEAQNATAFVLELDTPGGLDSSMREIIQREMNARVPVIVFVAPRGARAASAGCIIVLAADVAAMAPGTNIGAAHPIYISGGAVSEKIVNDAAAYARSIATARHRNAEWAERTVRESVSATAQEALSLGAVDFTANDVDDLLAKLDGRTIHRGDGDAKLSLAGATQSAIAMDARERILETLTDPTVAYVLFLLGVLAIVVEIFAPHGFLTGTIGAVAVILSLVGMINLPVQISGAALLILGMILLGLELKLTTNGVLILCGLIAFIFGSILVLPRVPGFRISPLAIGVVALLWAVMLGYVARLVMRSRHEPVLTGTQRVAGSSGVAKTELAPRGVVLVNGEEWDALADAPPIAKGDRISVVSIEGLTLHVRRIA